MPKYRIYKRRCIWCGLRFETNRPQTKHCVWACADEHHGILIREYRQRQKNPELWARAQKRERSAARLTWRGILVRFPVFSSLEGAHG